MDWVQTHPKDLDLAASRHSTPAHHNARRLMITPPTSGGPITPFTRMRTPPHPNLAASAMPSITSPVSSERRRGRYDFATRHTLLQPFPVIAPISPSNQADYEPIMLERSPRTTESVSLKTRGAQPARSRGPRPQPPARRDDPPMRKSVPSTTVQGAIRTSPRMVSQRAVRGTTNPDVTSELPYLKDVSTAISPTSVASTLLVLTSPFTLRETAGEGQATNRDSVASVATLEDRSSPDEMHRLQLHRANRNSASTTGDSTEETPGEKIKPKGFKNAFKAIQKTWRRNRA